MKKKVIQVFLIALLIIVTVTISCSQPLPPPSTPEPTPVPTPTPSEEPPPTPEKKDTLTYTPPSKIPCEWEEVRLSEDWGSIQHFTIVDDIGNVILGCGVGGSILRTTDGGYSWSEVARIPWAFSQITVDPNDPDVMCVVSRFNLYSSLDGGDSWQALDYPFDVGLGIGRDRDPCIDSEGRVYLYYDWAIWRGEDKGQSWKKIELIPRLISRYVEDKEKSLQYKFESIDGGNSWEKTMIYDRTTGKQRVVEGEKAKHWSEIYDIPFSDIPRMERMELPSEITALAIDPINPQIMYVGVNDYLNFTYVEGKNCHVPQVEVIRTTDGGKSWSVLPSTSGVKGLNQIMVDLKRTEIVYVQPRGRLDIWKSYDYGESWEPLVYLANPTILDRSLWEIYDNETAWKKQREKFPSARSIYDNYPFPLPRPNVDRSTRLAIDRNNTDNLLVTLVDMDKDTCVFSPKLFLSLDGGKSWSEVDTPCSETRCRLMAFTLISSGDSLILFAQIGGSQVYKATLSLKDLPD